MHCWDVSIFITVIVVDLIFLVGRSESLFFQALGLGASNCQCQPSCNSPPPPMGCFCPQAPLQMPGQQPGCLTGPSPQPTFPSYQPPQPAQYNNNNNYYPPLQNQGYAQSPLQLPPPPIPLQPPPIQVQPAYGTGAQSPPTNGGGYGGDTGPPAYPTFNKQVDPYQQQIKLQPPSRSSGTEYMKQFMKVFEPQMPSKPSQTESLVRNELPSSYYAGSNPNQSMKNTNTITETEQEPEMMEEFGEEGDGEEGGEEEDGGEEDNVENERVTEDQVQEMQSTSTYSSGMTSTYGSRGGYIPKTQFNSGKELRTTEIKLTQTPYEQPVPSKSYKTTHSGNYGGNDKVEVEEKVEATWTPSTDTYYTTTPTSKGVARKYSIEQSRGEGFVGATTASIAESGYEFTGPSSPLPPVTMDFREQYQHGNINSQKEIEAFTMDVDKYHRNSGSTIPLPSSNRPIVPTPPTDFGYGFARDPRHSNEESKKIEKSTQDQNLEEEEDAQVVPLLSSKIQGNSSNVSENNDFYDETTKADYDNNNDLTTEISKKQIDDKISKCNSANLKEMMHKKMTLSPSISKQMIYSAASEMFPGRNVNVVCSKHSFSYIVVTSPVFCEHRKRPLTCFAFFQP